MGEVNVFDTFGSQTNMADAMCAGTHINLMDGDKIFS